MNSLRQNYRLSPGFALAALVLTIGGAFVLPAHGQQANTNPVLVASAAALPAAPAASATPAAAPSGGTDTPWKGVYFGINVGFDKTQAGTTVYPYPNPVQFVNLESQTLHPDPSGVIGGIGMGYNYQKDHLVLGLEWDISGAEVSSTIRQSPIIQNNGTPFAGSTTNGNYVEAHEKLRWLSTVRPRFGYATSHVLVYATGGGAFGHANYEANTNFKPTGDETYPVTVGGTKVGYALGAGAEFLVWEHASVKTEYLYYDLGTQYSLVNPTTPNPPFQVGYNFETKGHIARIGVNFHF